VSGSAFDRRQAAVALATAGPPLAFVLAGFSTARLVPAMAAIVAVSAGLVRLEVALRETGDGAVSVATAIGVLYGTGLVWYAAVAPGPAAYGFLASTLLVTFWWRRPAGSARAADGWGVGVGAALFLGALALEALAGGRVTVSPSAPPVLDSLFSSRHGILFWTPLLTVAVLGLVERARRARPEAPGALAALGTLAVLNASVRPWWGGGMGNARFVPALPLFALGLATVLEVVRVTARERPLRLAGAMGAILIAWNLLLMAQYRRELVPRDDTVAFPTLVGNGAQIVAAAWGAPTAWPANWLFARRQHLPVARYDLLGGQDVLADGAVPIDLGDPAASAAMLGEGWSVRHACGTAVCREIEGGRAQVFLPVVDPRPAMVSVRAQGAGTLRLLLNGRPLAEAALGDEPVDVRALAGTGGLRRGVNELVLEGSPGGRVMVGVVSVTPAEAER
jgi:hypothetical protein